MAHFETAIEGDRHWQAEAAHRRHRFYLSVAQRQHPAADQDRSPATACRAVNGVAATPKQFICSRKSRQKRSNGSKTRALSPLTPAVSMVATSNWKPRRGQRDDVTGSSFAETRVVGRRRRYAGAWRRISGGRQMSSVGSGSVRAEKSLKAGVSGVGSLTWKARRRTLSTSVSGIGRVSKG